MRFVRLWAERALHLLAAENDQALLRARSSGERIVATLRLALVVMIIAVISFKLLSGAALAMELAVGATALAYAGGLYWWASRSTSPWLPWVSCALDITLTSVGIAVFIVAGDPLGAVNNRVLFDVYFFAIANSALRYDWRLCGFAVALACSQFLGLTAYAGTHWDLATVVGAPERFYPIKYALRIVVLLAAGASAIAVARWARHLRLMVGTDELTGLSQRRPFLERIEEQLTAKLPGRRVLSIAVLDIDEFKKFNDAFGHLAGDRALQLLAERLRSAVRGTDLVARFGGGQRRVDVNLEEFARRDHLPDHRALGAERRDERGDDDQASVGHHLRHFADAADVLDSIGVRESQVAIQPVAYVIPVEQKGMAIHARQLLLDQVRDRRLAGARQAREPQHRRFLVLELRVQFARHIELLPVDVAGTP